MKKRKIIFILLFPLVAEVVISCCDCLKPVIHNYSNKTISLNNIDNSGSEPIISSAETILKTAYGIRVQISREKIVFASRSGSVFIQSACAQDCFCPPEIQFLPQDSVISIRIFAVNDFDLNHLANADISDNFKVYKPHSFTSIKDYLKNSNLVLYDDSSLDIIFDLLLMTAPASSDKQKFKVQITLSDGRVLEKETSEIKLI